ncbi:hypothetical protein RRG08_058064 [Elysia crispata]|uniref:Uncharacterized protein n=1 Tax=Elysia crispata TaxID=231223 RepID=A0AAE1ABH5_9GAST|nr:hypothetical protein RRG08_058064 [Elysia crispata]
MNLGQQLHRYFLYSPRSSSETSYVAEIKIRLLGDRRRRVRLKYLQNMFENSECRTVRRVEVVLSLFMSPSSYVLLAIGLVTACVSLA